MSTQRQIDDMVRHWVHARVRFRTRYEKELSKEEWQRASALFRQHRVLGAKDTADGKTEGWVMVEGCWAFAVYSRGHGCIVTFLPDPPPRPSEVAESVEQPAAAEHKVIKELRLKQTEMSRLHNLELQRLKAHVQTLLTNAPNRAEDIAWFKNRVRDVASLLWTGKLLEAALLAETLVGLPKSFRPTKDLDAANVKVTETCNGRREIVREKWQSHGLPNELPTHRGEDPALIAERLKANV